MQNFVMILVAMSPLTVASPYGASPRDTSCCTSASSGAFSWTIEAFDYHSSETFTTPAHEVASGYVDFKLNNPALPEEVHCAATSSVVTNYFYGDVNYACNAPAGSQTKTSFTFNALNKGLSINQTWTCSDGNPQDSVTFTGYGAVNLTLDCNSTYHLNPNYTSPSNGFYSTSDYKCAPVTLPLTPLYKTVVA